MIVGVDASRAARAQRTGTEGYAYFLIHALIDLAVERGHRLRLYFNEPPQLELFPPAVEVEQVVIPFPRLWTHGRLAWELWQRPPDVFFTPAHVIPFAYRRPSVATVHDLGYHHFPEAHTWGQLVYLRWSTRHNGRAARFVIADSLATQTDLMRFYRVPEEKICVVYPGVDPGLYAVKDKTAVASVLQKYGITPPYLLYLSTLQPRKNVLRLIRAYVQSGVPHQLVIAGKKGWLAEPILNEIFHLDMATAKRIILPGYVPDEDKGALLSGATALLYPSLYEGFGFPVLEAHVCETAVLTSSTSSLPEIARHSALLIDPLDTDDIAGGIQRLATDAALRADLIQKGKERVKQFTWPKSAAQVMDLLEAAATGALSL